MKKIFFSLIIFLFSSVMLYSAEKQDCTKLRIGKAYFKCIKERVTGMASSSDNQTQSDNEVKKDGRSWYQKIKEGKPLFSK